MSEKIFNYGNDVYGFVSKSNMQKDEKVLLGVGLKVGDSYKNLWGKVSEIIEQRPERGVYENEEHRRSWQKVKVGGFHYDHKSTL